MRPLVIIAACLVAPSAWAHAFLDRASPPVGSEVSGSPSSLTLTYTEAVEPLFSSVQISGPGGAPVNDGKPTS